MIRKTVLKLFAFIMAVILSVSSLSVSAEALTPNQNLSGSLNKSVFWYYNKRSKKLDIYGEGAAVSETQWQNSYPWSDFASSIKSVEIGDGITEIGAFAFNDAKKLKAVTVSDTVKKVGAYAFSNTKWLSQQKYGGVYIGRCLYLWKGDVPLGSPSFKSNTYSISDYAFANNYSLTSLTIPSSIKKIGNNAFVWCESLKTVTFKKGLLSLGESAFSNCTSLQKVILPSTLKKIPSFAFSECKALRRITLPLKVTTVSDFAFYNCTALQSVYLSKNLKKASAESFYGCKSLKAVNVPDGNKYFSTSSKGALYNKKKTKLYLLPVGKNLTSFTLNSKTTTVASNAFADNSRLKKLTLSKKLQTIGEGAFSGCTNLKTISRYPNVKKMNNTAITDTLWYKNQKGLIYFGKVLLDYIGYMPEDTWLRIKEGTVSVASYALADKPGLTGVTFPDSLEAIGEHAFALCTGLDNVVIPASVKEIGQGAFRDCTGFGKITVLNPFCKINTSLNLVFPGNASLYCHKFSTAEKAAQGSNCSVYYLGYIDIKDLDITITSAKKPNPPKVKLSYYGNVLKEGVHYDISYYYGLSATVTARENSSCFTGQFTVDLETGVITS